MDGNPHIELVAERPTGDGFVECDFLMPVWCIETLERKASEKGLSMSEYVSELFAEYLKKMDSAM